MRGEQSRNIRGKLCRRKLPWREVIFSYLAAAVFAQREQRCFLSDEQRVKMSAGSGWRGGRPTDRPTPSRRSSQQESKEKVRGEEDRKEIRTRTEKRKGKEKETETWLRLIKDETNFCCFLFWSSTFLTWNNTTLTLKITDGGLAGRPVFKKTC